MSYFERLLLSLPAVMIAIVFGGFGEALYAYLMGDDTPKNVGQLSISPSKHLDLIGFFCLLIAHFGWGKPVLINENNFKKPKITVPFFYIAGPIANIIVAIIFIFIIKFLVNFSLGFDTLFLVLYYIVIINIGFAAIKLLPIPPFSGYYFLKRILPRSITIHFQIIEKYSMFIFLLLIFTNLASYIVNPIYNAITYFIGVVTGIHV